MKLYELIMQFASETFSERMSRTEGEPISANHFIRKALQLSTPAPKQCALYICAVDNARGWIIINYFIKACARTIKITSLL